ncbi:MAG: rod shape-determining protein MreD [Anaerolineae bacterium]
MGYYLGMILLSVFAILENSALIEMRELIALWLEAPNFYGQPSLVLIAVVAWSWHAELNEALFWAFVGGIALDVLNPIVPTGTSVIAILVTIFAVKAVVRLFYQMSIFALLAFISIGTVLHQIIIFTIFALQGVAIMPIDYFQNYMAPTLAFNLVLILPMYWLLRRFQKRLAHRQSPWAVNLG